MGIKLYDGLSSTVARSLATSDPAVTVRLDGAAPPAADTVFIADGVGAGTWGAPPAGELPEILAAIALADPPTVAGQAVTYDGTGITWAAPSGGGGSILTGNPYIDNSGMPTALDDEFDSGSPDLAVRGWKVYNRVTGAVAVRIGSMMDPIGGVGANQYRSSLYGSRLFIQTHPQGLVVVRDGLGIGATQPAYILRIGIPRGRLLSSQSESTSIPCDAQVGLIRSTVASGTSPRTGDYHRVLFGQRSGGNTYFGYDQSSPPYQRLRDSTDAQSMAMLSDVDCLHAIVSAGSGQWGRISLFNTPTCSHKGTHIQSNGGELSITNPTQVGFDLFNMTDPGNGSVGPEYALFAIDYFRNRPDSGYWFGL